jgi:hypothetical protein
MDVLRAPLRLRFDHAGRSNQPLFDCEPVAMKLGDLRMCGYLTAKRPYDDLWGERRDREGSATPSTEVASTWTQASGSRCLVSVC